MQLELHGTCPGMPVSDDIQRFGDVNKNDRQCIVFGTRPANKAGLWSWTPLSTPEVLQLRPGVAAVIKLSKVPGFGATSRKRRG